MKILTETDIKKNMERMTVYREKKRQREKERDIEGEGEEKK